MEQAIARAQADLDEKARQLRAEENTRLGQQREERLEAERQARIAATRAAADAELTARLRGEFFASNPSASESDYQRLLPKLKDEALLAAVRAGGEAAALRRSRPHEYAKL